MIDNLSTFGPRACVTVLRPNHTARKSDPGGIENEERDIHRITAELEPKAQVKLTGDMRDVRVWVFDPRARRPHIPSRINKFKERRRLHQAVQTIDRGARRDAVSTAPPPGAAI